MILNFLRKMIPERSPMRLFYHKVSAIIACIWFRFPAYKLNIIAITGTSGKSTTINLVHYLIQNSGHNAGAISTIDIKIKDETFPNPTLRTTLRPWEMQKCLRKMVKEKCEFCVLEVSSHAIDQNRIWGIPVDTAAITNVLNNEHLDYHHNFAEYVRTKTKLFRGLNFGHRKLNTPKVAILNRDDENYEIFNDFPADRKWSFSTRRSADVMAQNIDLNGHRSKFNIKLPNHNLNIKTPLVGAHNLKNITNAIAIIAANKINLDKIENLLNNFPGIPGRLEAINENQDFSVIVDFAYKPSALHAVLGTLKEITPGKIITVWGSTGGRTTQNRIECAKCLNELSDEVILTTDDPYDEDPKTIAQEVKEALNREEGKHFFEIEDRYEAIRYAILTAEEGDCVLIAGRGHEQVQTIGKQVIQFDDRVIAQEILKFAKNKKIIKIKDNPST